MSQDVVTTQPTWTNETVNDTIAAVSQENENNDLLNKNAVGDNAKKEEEKKKKRADSSDLASTCCFTPVNYDDRVEDTLINFMLCRWFTECCVSCCRDPEGCCCACCTSGEDTGHGGDTGDCCGDCDCGDCDCGDCGCGDCDCDCGDCSCFD